MGTSTLVVGIGAGTGTSGVELEIGAAIGASGVLVGTGATLGTSGFADTIGTSATVGEVFTSAISLEIGELEAAGAGSEGAMALEIDVAGVVG